MNSSLLSGQAAMPLIKGIYCLLSAEQARELTALLAKGACHQEGETSPLAVVTIMASLEFSYTKVAMCKASAACFCAVTSRVTAKM